MSRITCKSCRRLGESLCGREKCAYKKRPYAPGKLDSERKHRGSVSEYGEMLRAKQRMRISYGMIERQFSSYVKDAITHAAKLTGVARVLPGVLLYQKLESRLDNMVYRSGFAHTRALARQLVSHGHILVNGKRITIGSHLLNIGDTITVREGSKVAKVFAGLEERLSGAQPKSILTVDAKKLSATMSALPREVEPQYDTTKVLEYYSR